MSSAPPPIPLDQRTGAPGESSDAAETQGLDDRRDRLTGAQSGQPGDADVNIAQQGRFGGTIQNTTNQGKQQDR